MITLNASGGSVTFTFSGNSTYLNDGTIEVPVNSLALIIDESNMVTFRKAASNDIFVSANIAEFGMTKAELESWYKENMVGSTGGGVDSGTVQTMIDESISGKADSSTVTEEISAAVSGKADTNSLSAYTINEGIASSSQTYVVETPPYGSPSSIVNTLDNSYGGLRVYKVNNYSTCYLIGYDENDTEIGRITFSSENPTIVDTTGFTDVIINRERISDSASTAIVEGKELTAIKKFSFYNNYWATDEETSVYFYNKAYNVTDAVRFDFAKKADGINVTWGSWPELYITLTSGERTITGVAAYFDSKYFRSYYDQYDNHLLSIKESVFQDYAKSSAVTEEISAAVSGKVDTTTYTAYTANTQAVLNSKLDATAYTPVQVSTAITENDTNAVAGGAVYDKVHVTSGNGSTTLLAFGSEIITGSGFISAATNYQSGVTKFNIELDLTQWGRYSPVLGFRDSNNNNYAGQIINTDGVITYADRSDEMFVTSMSATTSYTNNVFTIEVTGLSGDAPSGLTMFGLANIEPVVNAYAVQGESVEYWIKEYVDAKVAELLALINNS